jgi:hypothetical protein
MPGTVIKFDAEPIRPPLGVAVVVDGAFCACDFRCDFEEKVFASDEGGIEADVSDFLFKKVAASDTIEFRIVKDGLIRAVISGNTYGTYYNGFPLKPLYIGWQADWTAIFNAFSGGRYQIQVATNILGSSSIFISRYFRLNLFDALEADRTVKLQTLQRGRFANGAFDFTGLLPLGWPTSIRLPGVFGFMQPELNRDTFQDSSYRVIQNRDTVVRQFKLIAGLVPESLQNRLAVEDVLANEVFLTSYNVLQEKKYEIFPVVPESFSEARFDGLGNTYFEIFFSDRQQNIIKTNTF